MFPFSQRSVKNGTLGKIQAANLEMCAQLIGFAQRFREMWSVLIQLVLINDMKVLV